uniref:Uncharacterized protein n=1 Tax=Romanomermis culicivorax TaxID=13658 RepID=A0A915JFG6_ROMCU
MVGFSSSSSLAALMQPAPGVAGIVLERIHRMTIIGSLSSMFGAVLGDACRARSAKMKEKNEKKENERKQRQKMKS